MTDEEKWHECQVVRLAKYNKGGMSNAQPECEYFPIEHPEVAMMAALTYAVLDTTREYSMYEVVDPYGMLLIRATAKWIYAPETGK